ncbi:MAG: hypothetical protein HND48_23845 [Chloroflexi bacterium]|nr:hypothetical protein [Chloroflexota bacterium]
MQAIMEANCLSSANLIHTGRTLFVPRDIGGIVGRRQQR